MDQDTTLSIAHLNKLFAEIKQNAPSIGSSQHVNEIHEQKIYNILPLFCKIFNNNESPPQMDIFEKFSDATSFTQMVSRLMVTEIRRRASNKTTENASIAIVEFLEISPTVTNIPANKKGWILLSTLNILVSFNSPQLISIMASNSLASTLVKCLYLFFDLPPCVIDQQKESAEESSDYLSNDERRQLLQKVFSQLLTRLCASHTALNDLTKKDDLILLFNVITSWCPEHNSMWRKTAADVIITMAKHGNINVEYLHSKNCIYLFVENVQRIIELGTDNNKEIILMLRTFILFMLEYVNNSINNGFMINILLDDFSECFGYQFFVDFAIKLEQSQEFDLLHDFLILVNYFTKIGVSVLKPRPLSVNEIFTIENFSIPKPTKNSIKNLKAFTIFISLWNKSKTEILQKLILDNILKIYKEDKANYFLLESQNTLSSFAERLEEKSESIQSSYYSLLEYIVTELNYVPCKELITIGMILKRQNSSQSLLLALRSLNNLQKLNAIFKDVFREVGLVDVLCSTYNYYVQLLEKANGDNSFSQTDIKQYETILLELGEILIQIIIGPVNNNCQILYECGASKHTFQLIKLSLNKSISMKSIRKRAFTIIQQLILSNNSEENLSQLLVLLHKDRSSFENVQEMINLKLSVLKSLLIVLSENHRIRALFRKIGGFVSVISVIVYMENYLCQIPSNQIADSKQIWNLLRCVFATITTAMRFEPANSKYFAQEICSPSFTDSLRLLGCFDENMFAWKKSQVNDRKEDDNYNYEELFKYHVDEIPHMQRYTKNQCACILMRLLHDMALDVLEKTTNSNNPNRDVKSNFGQQETPIIIYPCILDSMFQLLKFIQSSKLCRFLMEKICSLLSLERNIQVMCETGLITELLNSTYIEIILDETNVLHSLIRYIFERLSAHHIQAKDLRIFLRLSNPLNSIPLDEIKPKVFNRDRSIPLSLIKSIISISTPKDVSDNFLLNPPFIEFDMNQEGFSCIFIPSIAPISTIGFSSGPSSILTGAIVGNSDIPVLVNGGIGTGERAFPSQSGLSFTTWIYINKSDQSDNHTINVLTLYRATQSNAEYSCFKIYINLQDKAMTISTQELPIFSNANMNMNLDSDHNIRFSLPELLEENWHHIVVVLNRALLKNSTICVYINGNLKFTKKLSYISSIVGGSYGIANTSPLYINGFIGTPPQYRKHSKFIWKQGPCHLIEEALSSTFVSYIYLLGPNYIGSFQAINYKTSQNQQQQIAEDKLIFGLNARATSVMTLSKMRRVYSKFDCKQIAKIIGLSTHENATPIYVLHNSSGHLCGPSRPLGGILIGNIGARCFLPKQITLTFSDVGGSYLLLGLIANSQNMEKLYASVKALVCILRANRELQLEMERINGYQILAMLLKRKKSYLNSHVLHLLFDLINNFDSKLLNHTSRPIYINMNSNSEYPANFRAFKELLVDSMDIWLQSDLMKTLLEHLNEIINESITTTQVVSSENKDKKLNIIHLREMNLLIRLLNIFKDHDIKDERMVHSIIVICYRLLNQTTKSKDILYFGQFIVSLIQIGNDQKRRNLIIDDNHNSNVNLQNSLLKIILQLMSRNSQPVNSQMQEELVRILGFDWFLLFINNNLNMETIIIGLVNIMLVLSNPNLYLKFKEGSSNGNWLKDADSFIENRSGFQLLGFNISTNTVTESLNDNNNSIKNVTKIQKDLFTIPGFQHLNWLLSYHLYQPKMYLIIFQTIFGHFRTLTPQTLENIDSFEEITMENLLKVLLIDQKNFKQEKIICKDLILTVISIVNSILCSADKKSPKYLEYPKILIYFIKYLYNHNRDFRLYCQTNLDFLNQLCKSLIYDDSLNNNTGFHQMIDHPATKLILEFILAIFINIINTNPYTFSMNASSQTFFSNNKPCAIFNSILNYLAKCKKAQTEIMSLFMDCIITSQEFNQSSSSQIMNNEASANIILNFKNSYSNIVVLMCTVVDKLWQNCYVDDRKKILDCLIRILKINAPESKQHSNFKSLKILTSQISELTLLYKSINRCILYLISRNTESMSDRILLFEVLQLVHANYQLLIVSKCNNDSEFFVCLIHCLLQLVQEESISLSVAKDRTTWYIVESNKNVNQTDEGTLLITSMAKKIWEEIYLSRKSLLEETLKVSLSLTDSAFGVESSMPDISRFRDLLYETTLKYWSNYIESENQRLKRKPSSLSFDLSLPNSNVISERFTNINKFNSLVTKSAGGLMSKIVGGTSGVVGSAISSAVGTTRKEVFRSSLSSDSASNSSNNWTLMSKSDVIYWTSIHELIVKNFINFQLKQKKTLDYNLRKYIFNEWLNSEYEFLTRERAIWGPLYGSKCFDKWMLDMTEGPNRMRKKMIRNDQFYLNYPYKPEMENTKYPKFRSPISLDSRDYYKRIHSEKYFLLDKDEDIQSFEYEIEELCAPISDSNETMKHSLSDLNRSKTSSNNDDDVEADLQDSSDSMDIFECATEGNSESEKQGGIPCKKDLHEDNEMQTILRLLEEGEKISHMFRVARVQGLDSYEGLLLFGKEHFYLIDGFTLLKTKEIRDIDSLPPNVYDSIIPNTPSTSSVSVLTGKKVCNKFSFEDIKEVHKRRYLLQPIALEIFSMDGRNSLMVFPRNLRNKVYARFMSVAVHITDNAQDSLMGQKRNVNVETGGLLSNLIGETSVTQRWVRGEISNFQYLMNLNTLAGRSYNDLMQYPVFPWILADYTSYELDFNNPATFRDLSKPIGAQTPERLEQFKKRFNEWDADTNKGGDELIQGPYHYGTFYSSAMIVASYLVRIEPFTQHFLRLQGGHFDLADRMFHSIGDAWLSASKHNMADLKELIPEFFYLPEFLVNANRYDFGCKQNGTRLNDVMLPTWAKDDPREFIRVHRAALESDYVSAHLHEWIDLIFGYKQNGPAAVEAVNVFHHLFYEGNADIYNIDDPLKKNATIGFINNFGQVPMQLFRKPHPMKKAFNNFGVTLMSSLPPLLSSVNLTSSNAASKVFIHNLEYLKPLMHPIKELKGAVGQIVQQEKTILAVEQNKVLIPPLYNRCVAWGFADHSFRIGPYESDRALYVWESELFPPNGEILCATVPNSRIIITAGTNSVIYVWRTKTKSFVLSLHQKLYGHTEAVTCLASSSAYGIIVSGSRDKTCIIWDLNRFVFIRQLGGGPDLVHKSPIAAAAINDLTGDIATCCSTMLYLWSINGDLVAQVNTAPGQASLTCQNSSQILCLAFSIYNEWDPENVILTGSSDGVVKMWTLRYVQEPLEPECAKESCSSSSESSISEELKNSIALNPSKDEIVRRLSIVSTKNEHDDSTENSSTPVDEAQENEYWEDSFVNEQRASLAHSESFTENKFNRAQTNRVTSKVESTLSVPNNSIRNSKSDTALADSFGSLDNRSKQTGESCLKNGHRWARKLVFSSKLTMHTAYERKDNKDPAAITCIAVSKDHRNVFVGDARGRIFCWSVNENKNLSDHWIKDDVATNCTSCSVKFSITERKHHCRNCGKVFCARCSRFEASISRLKIVKPVRVCQNCFIYLQQQQPKSS